MLDKRSHTYKYREPLHALLRIMQILDVYWLTARGVKRVIVKIVVHDSNQKLKCAKQIVWRSPDYDGDTIGVANDDVVTNKDDDFEMPTLDQFEEIELSYNDWLKWK